MQKIKRALVTGAAGFIGSHLVERLIAEGWSVRAFVRYNSTSSWGWLESIPRDSLSRVEIFPGDIRDAYNVECAMQECELVFHLAALIAIPFSYHAPESYVDTNIRGGLNVLQAARKLKTERVLMASTSEVYGTAQYTPIDEKHPYQGQSPYSATKIAADRLAEAFFRSFDLPVVIVRPFNTYGPRQSARAVIPTIVTQLLAGAQEICLGSLSPKRDFNYVRDVCEAFLEISKADGVTGQEINIASGTEISIGELTQSLIAMINPKAKLRVDTTRIRPEKSEVDRLLGSNKKIMSLTGWRPTHDLEAGLRETIRWFREPGNLAKYKAGTYNI